MSKSNAHVSRHESTVSTISNHIGKISKPVASKDEILVVYSEVFDGIGHFPGPPYHTQVDPSATPKKTHC